MSSLRLSFASCLLALASVACAGTTINRLLAEPDRWRDREVQLRGDVVRSASVLGRGAYRLDDGTGTIWVVSTHGVPRQGARVEVAGRLRDVAEWARSWRCPPRSARASS